MSIDLSNKKYAIVYNGILRNKDIIITKNGNYYAEDGYTGLGQVQVRLPLERITINPKATSQTIHPSTNYEAIYEVTVNPVTSNIDENIRPENIKNGVTILGVEGSYKFITEDIVIEPSTTIQNITPTKDGFYNIKVNPVTSNIDSNIKAGNIKKGVTILGVTGNLGEANLTTIDITENGTYTPQPPYNGFSEVNVNVNIANNRSITITKNGTYIPYEPYTGFDEVIVQTIEPSGTINIIHNGIYDITAYENANVSVTSTYYNIPRTTQSYMYNNQLITSLTHDGIQTFQLPQGITDLDNYALAGAFWGCTSLTSVNLSNLTTVSKGYALQNAFRNCTSLTSIDLSNLTTIEGSYTLSYTFVGCTSLTSVSFPKLTILNNQNKTVSYVLEYTFSNCTSLTSVNFPKLAEIGETALFHTFEGCTSLTSISFPSLTTIDGEYGLSCTFAGSALISADLSSLIIVYYRGLYQAFKDCTFLKSVNLSSLTTIVTDYALSQIFYGCTALTSFSFPNLTMINGGDALEYGFRDCSSLTTISFPKLTTISGEYALNVAFFNCGALTTVNFPKLNLINGEYGLRHAFYSCTSLKTLSFPALTSNSFGSYTNQFDDMLYKVIDCTVHFPSNLQSVIGFWSSVTNGFRGTNTTVLFDLPATS